MQSIEWKPIKDYEDLYMISNKELSFDEENELGFFNYDDEEILEEN